MRPGFGSFALGWNATQPTTSRPPISAVEMLRYAHSLGYRCVQFADNLPLHHLESAERHQLAGTARSLDVELELGARGLKRETLETYTAIAAEMGSRLLRLVIDDDGYHPGTDEAIRLLRAHVPFLHETNVVLGIENHDRFPAAEIAQIIESVASTHVGVCLDTANSFGAGEDPGTVIAALGRHTVNLHLKDVRIQRFDHHQGFTICGTPLGDGQLPLAKIVAEVARHRRCRSATLEHWIAPEADANRTFLKALEWCKRSTNTMRRLFPSGFAVPA